MENESREMIYLSISLMLLALVISFAAFGFGVIRNIAKVRNNEVANKTLLDQYRQFSSYQKTLLTGSEAIECITLNYDKNVDIYVNKEEASGTGKCAYCMGSVYDHHYYNKETYMLHRHADVYKQFEFKIDGVVESGDTSMSSRFPNSIGTSTTADSAKKAAEKAMFRAYLIYDGTDVKRFYDDLREAYESDTSVGRVGAVGSDLDKKLVWLDAKYDDMTSGMANLVVTGILLIRADTILSNFG